MLPFATMENISSFFSLFGNNLFNWVVLIFAVGWLWNKFMPPIFAAREESILNSLKEAAAARAEGEAFLAEQKQKIANAEKEMEKILAEARQVATEMKHQMDAQTEKEMADLKVRIGQEMANERQLAISQLRSAAAKAALALTVASLPAAITDGARSRLVGNFVNELEVASN